MNIAFPHSLWWKSKCIFVVDPDRGKQQNQEIASVAMHLLPFNGLIWHLNLGKSNENNNWNAMSMGYATNGYGYHFGKARKMSVSINSSLHSFAVSAVAIQNEQYCLITPCELRGIHSIE